jgi:hypothetical protein
MATSCIDRPLTFAVPQVGATAQLPQQAALGTVARIRQTNRGYFTVIAQGTTLGERRYYTVRAAGPVDEGTPEGYWVVERPRTTTGGEWVKGYEKAAQFKPSHLRAALAWAVRYVTADWIIEVRDGGQAR